MSGGIVGLDLADPRKARREDTSLDSPNVEERCSAGEVEKGMERVQRGHARLVSLSSPRSESS